MVSKLNAATDSELPETARPRSNETNRTIEELVETIQANTKALTALTNLWSRNRGEDNSFTSSLIDTNSQQNTNDENNIFSSLITPFSNTISNTASSIWNTLFPKKEAIAQTQDNPSQNPSSESSGIISKISNLSAIQNTLDSFNKWEKNMWASYDAQEKAQRDEDERIAEEHRQEELDLARRDEERRTEEHRQEELDLARRDEERRREESSHTV